jgi:hypothetical protein
MQKLFSLFSPAQQLVGTLSVRNGLEIKNISNIIRALVPIFMQYDFKDLFKQQAT